MRIKKLKALWKALFLIGTLVSSMSAWAQTPTLLLDPTNSTWSYFPIPLNETPAFGDTWKDVTFDDSTWATGVGLFGQETAAYPYPINTAIAAPASGGGQVSLFRTHFTWSGSPQGVVLTSTNQVDDGMVVYLNGVEAGRYNMPAGDITLTTQSPVANPSGEPVTIVLVLDSSTLVTGDNVIAVSLHQAGNSSDDVFGMRLIGSQAIAPVITDTSLTNRTVVQGRTTMLTISATGIPAPTYQWFKDGVAVEGATGVSLTITDFAEDDAGDYFVRATNQAGSADSRVATLTYAPDASGPTVASAVATSTTTIVVTMDEPIDPTSVFPHFEQMLLFPRAGGDAIPWEEEPAGPGFVILSTNSFQLTTATPITLGLNYSLFVSGVADIYANTMANATVPVAQPVEVFGIDQEWSYLPILPRDVDPIPAGEDWRTASFDDSTWASGLGLFGNDSGYPFPFRTTIAGPSGGGARVVYFRTHFNWSGGTSGVTITSTNYFDDGMIMYINGVEVARSSNMPAGPIVFNTLATGTLTEPASRTFAIPPSALVQGDNVVAVSVHNNADTSSDTVFGMILVAITSDIVVQAPECVNAPESQSVDAGGAVTFTVTVSGTAPFTYQWLFGGDPIEGATGSSLNITNANPSQTGVYSVSVNNIHGNTTCGPASLVVIEDTTPPVIVAGAIALDLTTLRLVFDETIDAASVNTANIQVAPAAGGAGVTVQDAQVVRGTNLVITTATRTAGVQYAVTLSGIADVWGNAVPAGTRIVPTTVVIDVTTPWSYFPVPRGPGVGGTETDPYGDTWIASAFDDSSWDVGTPLVGTDTTTYPWPFMTAIPAPNNATTPGPVIVYLRTSFHWSGDTAGIVLTSTNFIDDGMVVYLNGTEILRYNMTNAAIAFDTFATAANPIAEPSILVTNLPSANLVAGENVLAVSVHNNSATSSDTVFGMQIVASTGSVTEPELSATKTGNTIVISWSGTGFHLEERASLTAGDWADVPGGATSPVTLPITGFSQFFRLANE